MSSGYVNIPTSVPGDVQTIVGQHTTARILNVSGDVGSDVTGDGTLANPYKTIQAAINAAIAFPATYNTPIGISISPSATNAAYTENLTISQQGIALFSAACIQGRNDLVTLFGSITVNLTGTAGGGNFTAVQNNCYINGMQIVPASGNCIIFSGSTYQRLFISNCLIGQSSTSNAIVCSNTGTSGGSFSTITVRNCDIQNTSATNATISHTAGNLFIAGDNPSITNATSGGPSLAFSGNSFTANNASIIGTITNSGTGSAALTNTTVTSATSSALLTVSSSGSMTLGATSLTNTTSTGSGFSNAGGTITIVTSLLNIGTGSGAYVAKGTGVFVYANNAFVSNKNLQNTLTIVPLAITPTTGA